MQEKVALVTGGTSGIGLGVVKIFAEDGFHVVFCGKPSENVGYDIESEINSNLVNKNYTGSVTFIPCDVTKEESIKYALPHLRKTKGSIIFNSSLVAQIGQLHAIPYVTTKGAITSMSRAMAIDEAEYGVRVNWFVHVYTVNHKHHLTSSYSVSPSNIWTPLWAESCKLNDHIDAETIIKTGENAQLMGRMGTPEEVGQLCLFLSTNASFMTGVDIPISGGAELNYGLKSRVS